MPVLTIPAVSTQPFQQQVYALSGGSAYDPTSDPVAVAFIAVPGYGPVPSPGDSDWHTASWETDAGPAYFASILVGPANGGLVLTQGTVYQAFVKVTDNPAVPVLPGWLLQVT